MKLAIGTLLLIQLIAQSIDAQTTVNPGPANSDSTLRLTPSPDAAIYAILNATPKQESALRTQVLQMHPDVLPLRIVFLSHWKYLDTARIFRLHVPTGFASAMFTHLPSRTVFIDNDRYLGEDWLGYWLAHELGHLASNSAKEDDAERVARQFRKRLK